MTTFSINTFALGPVVLVLILSMVAGTAIGLLTRLALGMGSLVFGMVEIIAGGRSYPDYNGITCTDVYLEHGVRGKVGVALRTVVYIALCIGAIALSLSGFQALAFICAVAGGVALPIALIKLTV